MLILKSGHRLSKDQSTKETAISNVPAVILLRKKESCSTGSFNGTYQKGRSVKK